MERNLIEVGNMLRGALAQTPPGQLIGCYLRNARRDERPGPTTVVYIPTVLEQTHDGSSRVTDVS